MFCNKCGNEVKDTDTFCTKCGNEIEKGIQPAQESQENVNQANNSNKNGIAIAGFVCSFFIPILGWVFGGIGLARANKRGGVGKGFSIAAIAIASVMILISLSMY